MNQEFDLRKSVRRTNSVSFHGIFFGGFARLPSGQAIHSKRLQLSFAISKSADSSNLYILFLENFSANFLFFFLFFFLPIFSSRNIHIFLFTFREEKIFFTRFSLRRRKWRSRIFFLFLPTRRNAFDFSIIVEINEETKRLIGNRISRIDERLLIGPTPPPEGVKCHASVESEASRFYHQFPVLLSFPARSNEELEINCNSDRGAPRAR